MYWIDVAQDTGQVAVSYEHGNGLSGSVTGGNLAEELVSFSRLVLRRGVKPVKCSNALLWTGLRCVQHFTFQNKMRHNTDSSQGTLFVCTFCRGLLA